MLLYNLLTELNAHQLLGLLAVEAVIVVAVQALSKFKWTAKHALIVAAFALGLSLLSALSAVGAHCGSMYCERFGWPLQFREISRYAEADLPLAVPAGFYFRAYRFVANALFWAIVPFAALTWHAFCNKGRRQRVVGTVLLMLPLLMAALVSYHNRIQEQVVRIEGKSWEGTEVIEGDLE